MLSALVFCQLFNINAYGAATQYSYDDLHRLTRVERDDGSVTVYEYDDLGNRTSMLVASSPAAPTALFTADETSGIAPLPVTFTDQSIGEITSWLWDFGDNETSTEQSPSHTYNAAGLYTVILTVTGPGGSDAETKPDHVWVWQDSDSDGLPDSLEDTTCTNPNEPDTDNDGIIDGIEDANHDGVVDPTETDPCNNDTDGDGMPDGWEVDNNLNPLVNDAFDDADGDEFCNWREFLAGTDPNLIGDTPLTITIYVDDDNTSGIEDGSAGNPFNTVQEGVDFGGPGDTVSVAAGNYVDNLLIGEDIFLVGQGADVTVIDGTGASLPVIGCNNMAGGRIEGFHIQNGTDAGIQSEQSTLSIERNVISNTANGVGIQVGTGSSLTITNNVIYENDLDGIGFNGVAVTALNNTIVSNGGDGVNCAHGDGVVIENNIIVSQGGYGIYCDQAPEPQISCNDVWANTVDDYSGCTPGAGDISGDPLFENSTYHDYHLTSGSPCIDAGMSNGAPEFDFDGFSRYDDPDTEPNTGTGAYTFYDIGAYEYLLFCKGDFDGDGDVDESDLATFAADFGRTDCDTGEPCEGDFDNDNDVDGSDVAVFAADFGRTDCP